MVPISVYAEMTPNPNTMKYVANTLLVPEGLTIELNQGDNLSNYPLAARLFTFPFVTRVFITNNFVTVTKSDVVDWNDVTMELREYISNYLTAGHLIVENPDLLQQKPVDAQSTETADDLAESFSHVTPQGELETRIVELLDEYVQPAVENDGGAIHFKSFDAASGKLYLTLKGSCNGCPSSTATLRYGIQNLFERMLPEVKEVVAQG